MAVTCGVHLQVKNSTNGKNISLRPCMQSSAKTFLKSTQTYHKQRMQSRIRPISIDYKNTEKGNPFLENSKAVAPTPIIIKLCNTPRVEQRNISPHSAGPEPEFSRSPHTHTHTNTCSGSGLAQTELATQRGEVVILLWPGNSGDRDALSNSLQPVPSLREQSFAKIITSLYKSLYLSDSERLLALLGEKKHCCRLAARYAAACHELHSAVSPLSQMATNPCLLIHNSLVICLYHMLLQPSSQLRPFVLLLLIAYFLSFFTIV